jgi:dihydrofolate synthase/folylpolyglutamate synthase
MSSRYQQVVQSLEQRGVMPDRAPSLEPTREGLRRLDLGPIGPERVIIVAGTNGKGSVCATLEALLIAAGENVGLYTSPHLVETTERIRIGGVDVSQEVFCAAHDWVASKTEDLKLSHFEMLTLMAAWVFFSGIPAPAVKRAIFEVGLGGLWDSTNAIPHSTAIITSLGLDHQNILGNSLQEIARNKFGVVGAGMAVVHSPLPEAVKELAKQTQEQTRSRWIASAEFGHDVQTGDGAPRFEITTRWGRARISLPGKRGAQNTATALTAFETLGYEPSKYLHILKDVRWPGRMEKFEHPRSPCPIYLSGDHNPQGVHSLLELLPFYRRKNLHIVVGIGKDKDLDGVLAPLFALHAASITLTEIPFRPRALADYGPWLDAAEAAIPDPKRALDHAIACATSEDMILVTGSLYLVGEIKKAK